MTTGRAWSRESITHVLPFAEAVLRREPTCEVDYERADLAEPVRRSAAAKRLRLALTVPVTARDQVFGYVSLDEPGERRRFSKREQHLVRAICDQAATAIENARLYDDQRRIALRLQEHFIHPVPDIAGLRLGVVSRAAHAPELVGGDFHDVFELPDGRTLVAIGDVAGKGVPAAGLTETVRSAVRAIAAVDPSPSFVARTVSEVLLQRHPDEGAFVTLALAVLDPRSGELSLTAAGHPPPLRLAGGRAEVLMTPSGPPLGTFAFEYDEARTVLEHGETVVFYTDGLTEARRDGDLFGERRLLAAASRLCGGDPQLLAEGLRDAAVAYAGQLRDDLQILVVTLE